MGNPRFVAALAVLAAICAGGSVRADGDAASAAQACIEARIAQGASPSECVDTRLLPCTGVSSDTPAVAVLCFNEAETEWAQASRAILDVLKTNAPERISALAAIELKYDLLSGLLQCDRIEELALAVSDYPPGIIARQKAQCRATANGLAHVRLAWRARTGK